MFEFIEVRNAINTLELLSNHLEKSDTILDLGSGSGFVAQLIRDEIGAEVICLDVGDYSRKKGVKPIIFCGNQIPFCRDAFTVTICCFVLHHIRRPEKLLKETKRVTKSKIIVLEDVVETPFDYLLTFLHKMYSGIRYQSIETKFRSDKEWITLFSNMGFRIEKKHSISKTRDKIYPVSRRFYLLRKGDG